MRTRNLLVMALCLIPCVQVRAATLSAAEAQDHVGESATVCGAVASARHATSVKGEPTFLNLDKAYPKQIFTVLVWGEDRRKFASPPESLSGHHICVSGTIAEHKGKAEIIVHEPGRITEQ